jgi:hypothetical protein
MLPYLMPLTPPPIQIVVFQTERALGIPDWIGVAGRGRWNELRQTAPSPKAAQNTTQNATNFPRSVRYPKATAIEAAMAAPFLRNYPQQVQIGSPDPGSPEGAAYELKADYYALTYDPDSPPPAQAIATIDGIAIFAGEPIDPSATAVYGLGQAMAVPTGQVFVRFAKGNAADRQAAIAAAGYQIAEPLDYAPEAAWLRASSGSTADALTQLAALKGLDNIAAIEPQLVMARSLR